MNKCKCEPVPVREGSLYNPHVEVLVCKLCGRVIEIELPEREED